MCVALLPEHAKALYEHVCLLRAPRHKLTITREIGDFEWEPSFRPDVGDPVPTHERTSPFDEFTP